MREILFRGKRLDNGEWVEGSLWTWGEKIRIHLIFDLPDSALWFRVDPNTVGQYTGLCDKNGKKIFEGDIVQDSWNKPWPVLFCTEDVASCGCCYPEFVGSGFKAKNINLMDCYVIGNIHDNPDLLKGE
jgi:hypothetical protein